MWKKIVLILTFFLVLLINIRAEDNLSQNSFKDSFIYTIITLLITLSSLLFGIIKLRASIKSNKIRESVEKEKYEQEEKYRMAIAIIENEKLRLEENNQNLTAEHSKKIEKLESEKLEFQKERLRLSNDKKFREELNTLIQLLNKGSDDEKRNGIANINCLLEQADDNYKKLLVYENLKGIIKYLPHDDIFDELIEVFANSLRCIVDHIQENKDKIHYIKYFDLSGMDLYKINLSGINLSHFNLSLSSFKRAQFYNSTLSKVEGYKTSFIDARLEDAKLYEAKFREAKFVNSNLSRAKLLSGKFNKANFKNAKFFDAEMQDAHFDNSSLASANFKNANVNNTYFYNIKYDDITIEELRKTFNRSKANFSKDLKSRLS